MSTQGISDKSANRGSLRRAERRFRVWLSMTALLAVGGLVVGAALAQDADPEAKAAAPAAATAKPSQATAESSSAKDGASPAAPSSTTAPAPSGAKAAAPPAAPADGERAPAADKGADKEAPAAAPAGQSSPEAESIPAPAPEEPKETPVAAPPPEAPPADAAPADPPAPPAEEAKPDAPEEPTVEPAPVRIGGRNVYVMRTAQGALSPAERARAAEQAIRKAVDSETPDSVRIEHLNGSKVIYAGKIPLVHLTPADAAAAGDASLDVHADRVATELRDVIGTEQKRSAIATTIFSFSLAALLTLAALLLLRKTSEITEKIRNWVTAHRENIPGIKLQSVEVVDAATIRSAVALGVEVSKWVLRVGIVYVWLLLTLSLFESTREYTQDLTGIVLTPLSSLMARVAKSLPVVVVALIAAAVIAVLVRFVDLFFAGVARGETKLSWLAPDLAAPTSVLLRFAIVLSALVFAAPVVTGDAEGALVKIGAIVLGALGLASTPLLASCILGATVLYGRRLRTGDYVEFGGRSGRVVSINLLEVRLEDSEGNDLRVPHLLSLFHSTRVIGPRLRASIELVVASQGVEVYDTLRAAAVKVGDRAKVEIVGVERGGVRYRISVVSGRLDVRNALFFSAMAALEEAGVPLSREAQPMAGVA